MVLEWQPISGFVRMRNSDATIKMSLRNGAHELEWTIELECNVMHHVVI
jgi:hypothetical protein